MPVIVKLIIAALLIFMVYNLFKAMLIMLKEEPSKEPMSKYLGRRVGAAVAIILIIIVAMATGVITPNPRPY